MVLCKDVTWPVFSIQTLPGIFSGQKEDVWSTEDLRYSFVSISLLSASLARQNSLGRLKFDVEVYQAQDKRTSAAVSPDNKSGGLMSWLEERAEVRAVA